MSAERCGTYAGAQQHRRAKEPLCPDCRSARAAYMRRWRKERPELHAENVATQAARDRALRRLALRHPDELAALYGEELASERTGQERAS